MFLMHGRKSSLSNSTHLVLPPHFYPRRKLYLLNIIIVNTADAYIFSMAAFIKLLHLCDRTAYNLIKIC